MHLKRWLTGIVAAPILIYVIGFGPRRLFHALLFLIAIQGLVEFFRFATGESPRFLRWAMYASTFLLFVCISAGEIFLLPVVVFIWAAVPMIYTVFTYRREGHATTEIVAKNAFGPIYIALPLSMLMIIERFPRGRMWIFFLLVIVFACDTGAFYAGRIFGRHKLHPSVSPGKTMEGAVGGLVISLLAAFVWTRFSTIHPFDIRMLFLAAALAVSGQLGDLAESMLKRNHGVKDSGAVLPGHGGVLDRIDAQLFAIPVLFAYLSWALP